MTTSLYVTTRDQWRAWLNKNHRTKKEIWLIFYKKGAGKPTIPYNDAVEEALCYGWIDSIIKRIDSEKYVRKFTPRKDNSKWSDLNKKRVRKMIQEGRMTEAGLAKIDEKVLTEENTDVHVTPREFIIPPEIKEALQANKTAWKNFLSLAPGYKRQYLGWVTDAKREETQKRRLNELITVLEKNEKLGMK